MIVVWMRYCFAVFTKKSRFHIFEIQRNTNDKFKDLNYTLNFFVLLGFLFQEKFKLFLAPYSSLQSSSSHIFSFELQRAFLHF